MKRVKRKIIIISAGILLSLTLFLGAKTDTLWAVFDEEEAVHIKPDEIEYATLIIGTHLVHLSSLNDTLYKIASDSAGLSGQTEFYYKSELGDGNWYSLSNAKSLTDITEKGRQISDSVIGKLWLTHHTKSDGKTYDLRTGEVVSVYNIISPYALRELPELQSLELMSEAGRDLDDFFETNVRNEETEELDQQIAALEEQKEVLLGAGLSQEQAEMLDRTIERVDALRRNIVYVKVREALERLTDKLGVADEALNTALGDSIRQVEDAILETENDMLDEGETEMAALETELQEKLIELAVSGQGKHENSEQYLKILKSLAALNNIVNGISTDPKEEKCILEEELIPRAKAAGEQASNELKFYEKVLAGYEEDLEKDALEMEETKTLTDDEEQETEGNLSVGEIAEVLSAEAYIFPKVSGADGMLYVSAETLASYISYRYIFSIDKKEVMLAYKGDFYRFRAFDHIVERKGGEEIVLQHPCRFRTTVYIPGDYAEEEFAVRICELYGTGYCVITDENL